MIKYEVTIWVNCREYLNTHDVYCQKLKMIDSTTLLLDDKVKISFEENIQKISDTTNGVILFEDDDY